MPLTPRSDGQLPSDRSAQQEPALDAVALTDWVENVLSAAGLSTADARLTAEMLMFSQARGVMSHGLSLTAPYVERLRHGGTNLSPVITRTEREGVCLIDADGAVGAVGAVQATDAAAGLARRYGIGLAVARAANHVGALAFYVQKLANQGLIGIMASNADPSMAPPGGGRPVLGSNPLAIAVPDPQSEGRIVLDMATSAAAHGRIVAAFRQGKPIPADWAVDSGGAPTTDPAAALGGALRPAGGYKGFGLAFMIDALAAGLSGGPIGRDIVPLAASTDQQQQVSLLVIAIDPEYCMGVDFLANTVGALESQIASSRRPLDADAPLAPGVPEATRAGRNPSQVEVDAPLVAQLTALGDVMGIPFPGKDSWPGK